MSNLFRTVFHRTGYVTFWNVYAQQWQRCHPAEISKRILATLPDNERERIQKIAAKAEVRNA